MEQTTVPSKVEQPAPSEKSQQSDQPAQSEKLSQSDQMEKSEQSDQSEQPVQTEKSEQCEKTDSAVALDVTKDHEDTSAAIKTPPSSTLDIKESTGLRHRKTMDVIEQTNAPVLDDDKPARTFVPGKLDKQYETLFAILYEGGMVLILLVYVAFVCLCHVPRIAKQWIIKKKAKIQTLDATTGGLVGCTLLFVGPVIYLVIVFLVVSRSRVDTRYARETASACLETYEFTRGQSIRLHAIMPEQRIWPCKRMIPLTGVEIISRSFVRPFHGDLLFIEHQNAAFINKHHVACAGPAIYGVPFNIISLARDGSVLYNAEISAYYGEKQFVTEQSLTGDVSRSRLVYPQIEVQHYWGVINITTAEEAYCLQGYLT